AAGRRDEFARRRADARPDAASRRWRWRRGWRARRQVATTPAVGLCKESARLRVTLLLARMTSGKPLDLTLEVAPKARFDVVEMRSRFAAAHRALAHYSHCPFW